MYPVRNWSDGNCDTSSVVAHSLPRCGGEGPARPTSLRSEAFAQSLSSGLAPNVTSVTFVRQILVASEVNDGQPSLPRWRRGLCNNNGHAYSGKQ